MIDPKGPVGVLALQGDFAAHCTAITKAGYRPKPVRTPGELTGLSAFVLPGGESTTMLKLLAREELDKKLNTFAKAGGPILATCAGVVLLAKSVTNPVQNSLGLLDLDVFRIAYGRQVHSAIHTIPGPGTMGELEAIFIRAPRITRVGRTVEVLASLGEDPVLVRQDAIVAATFHPEISQNNPIHRWFLEHIAKAQ